MTLFHLAMIIPALTLLGITTHIPTKKEQDKMSTRELYVSVLGIFIKIGLYWVFLVWAVGLFIK